MLKDRLALKPFPIKEASLFSQLKEEKWAPDFGPATFVPTWGGTVTGVNHHLDHDEDR